MLYYRVWHMALLGVPCSTLGLRWMRKVNVSHRFSPYASKCPVKGCRTMRLLSFPSDGRKSMDLNISWDLAIQNATVDEMRCVCVGWWNSLRWFKFRLAGVLGSSTVPSKYFLAQYDHGLRCRGFCSPILLLLPLLKQFNTPHLALLKHFLFHVNYAHMCDG